jgi:exopolysaccharide biosynthesis protein
MKQVAFLLMLCFMTALPLHAGMSITPWQPLYKGIDLAIGTNTPDATINRLQVANCLKVDLHDPDVQLFVTPRITNYLANARETPSASITTFVRRYGVQVATCANFYNASNGESDPMMEGIPCNVLGLLVSNGEVVSAADNNKVASLLFTTNKVPSFQFNNQSPGTNTTGIFTAVTGYYPVLSNGVNVGAWASNTFQDLEVHTLNPRTIFGVSQDKRYFYMITIDGRQAHSEGALDIHSAIWAQAFGAWEAINMDGGGSAAMYMADCGGNPIALNRSSYLALGRGRERYIGSHLGVYAKPLPDFINDVKVSTTDTSANILWTTLGPTSGNVDYGPNANYGNSTPYDAQLRTKHVATVRNLVPGTTNYFRINASTGSGSYTKGCSLVTSNLVLGSSTVLFNLTKGWKYNWTNLNGVNWTAPGYNDSSWAGPSPGLLYLETNSNVAPKNTSLPANGSLPYTTYYFRTRFNLAEKPMGGSLIFSNHVDDGAVFYLNGVELFRTRMPVGSIVNTTTANGVSCSNFFGNNTFFGDACTNCADVITVPSALLANLVEGDNVLAVEVHNQMSNSPDLVFGSTLFLNTPPSQSPILGIINSESTSTLWWNGAGFKIQRSTQLGPGANWLDLPGPVTNSPYSLPSSGTTTFYRLRNL